MTKSTPPRLGSHDQALPRMAIFLPDVSGTAYLRADGSALEKIELWVDDFAGRDAAPWEISLTRLEVMDRRFISFMLNICLVDATPAEAFEAMSLSDIATKLSDALCMPLYGRTYHEQAEHQQAHAFEHAAKIRKQLEENANVDPQ